MRLLLYRNCQMLSMFSFEPSNGVSSLRCWNLEDLRGLWCLRVWKKNKCIRSSSDLPLFPCILVFTMPRPAVKLWKWGPKYLKEEIRCWESSPATPSAKFLASAKFLLGAYIFVYILRRLYFCVFFCIFV